MRLQRSRRGLIYLFYGDRGVLGSYTVMNIQLGIDLLMSLVDETPWPCCILHFVQCYAGKNIFNRGQMDFEVALASAGYSGKEWLYRTYKYHHINPPWNIAIVMKVDISAKFSTRPAKVPAMFPTKRGIYSWSHKITFALPRRYESQRFISARSRHAPFWGNQSTLNWVGNDFRQKSLKVGANVVILRVTCKSA